MKWYNETTGEMSSECPCWPAKLDPDIIAEEYPDWKEVDDDFAPPVPLDKQKAIKMAMLKREIATPLIYEKAPAYKQINAALGIYDLAENQQIMNWIHDVRNVVNQVEAAIMAAETAEDLDKIIVDYNDIKKRAEAIDAQEGSA